MLSTDRPGTERHGIDRLAQLNALHLYGMATAWSELLAEYGATICVRKCVNQDEKL